MKQIGELRKISTDIKYLSGNFWFIFCISKQVVQTTRQDILSDNGTIQRNFDQNHCISPCLYSIDFDIILLYNYRTPTDAYLAIVSEDDLEVLKYVDRYLKLI